MDMTVAIFHLSSFETILCHFVWLISCVQEANDKWAFQLMIAQIDALERSRKVYTACSIHLSSLHVYSWHFVVQAAIWILIANKMNSPVAMD